MSNISHNKELASVLLAGGVAVIRTDTLYGLVACADNYEACKKVYVLKKRTPSKSCIILLDSPERCYGDPLELSRDITQSSSHTATSFLVSSPDAPQWLLCENSELAYRVPADQRLRDLLVLTGPLIAPSANPEGLPPARTIEEARRYFGDSVDIYVDDGEVPEDMRPSRLVRVHKDGSTEWLR